MTRTPISTAAAPQAIGTYSQAVRVGDTVYLSGQIALDPATGTLVTGGIDAEIRRVLDNLSAVAAAAGGALRDCVKLTVYLRSLDHFPRVNAIMTEYLETPYPARAAVGVADLPRGAAIEIDAIMVLRGTS